MEINIPCNRCITALNAKIKLFNKYTGYSHFVLCFSIDAVCGSIYLKISKNIDNTNFLIFFFIMRIVSHC